MNPRAVQQEGFTVVGIAVRTSNAQQMTEARPIGKQWERLFHAGMTAKNVPAGRYAVFTSDRGPVQKVVVDVWRRVWETQKSALGGDRTYKTDFELYDQRAQNPADSVVDLYVAVR